MEHTVDHGNSWVPFTGSQPTPGTWFPETPFLSYQPPPELVAALRPPHAPGVQFRFFSSKNKHLFTFNITLDNGVMEVRCQPSTLEQLRSPLLRGVLTEDIFQQAADLTLHPHAYKGSGHVSVDLATSVGDSASMLRNFLLLHTRERIQQQLKDDCEEPNEEKTTTDKSQFMQMRKMIARDLQGNAPLLFELAIEQKRRFVSVLAAYDALPVSQRQFTWDLLSLVFDRRGEEVHILSHHRSCVEEQTMCQHFHAFNLQHVTPFVSIYRPFIPYGCSVLNRRIELRRFTPQPDAATFLDQLAVVNQLLYEVRRLQVDQKVLVIDGPPETWSLESFNLKHVEAHPNSR